MPQYSNLTNISAPNTLADQSLQKRLDLIDSRLNDLVQSAKNPHKDIWDKFGILSGFLSGVVLGSIALYFSLSYKQAQQVSEKNKIISYFVSFLDPNDPRVVKAALSQIEMLDQDVAINLAEVFICNGGIAALSDWSKSSDKKFAKKAQEVLHKFIESPYKDALELHKAGKSREDIVETMKKNYVEAHPYATSEEVRNFAVGIDYLLRSQKKEET